MLSKESRLNAKASIWWYWVSIIKCFKIQLCLLRTNRPQNSPHILSFLNWKRNEKTLGISWECFRIIWFAEMRRKLFHFRSWNIIFPPSFMFFPNKTSPFCVSEEVASQLSDEGFPSCGPLGSWTWNSWHPGEFSVSWVYLYSLFDTHVEDCFNGIYLLFLPLYFVLCVSVWF